MDSVFSTRNCLCEQDEKYERLRLAASVLGCVFNGDRYWFRRVTCSGFLASLLVEVLPKAIWLGAEMCALFKLKLKGSSCLSRMSPTKFMYKLNESARAYYI